jgi:hypothetical protein
MVGNQADRLDGSAKLFSILKPQKFTPECPHCHRIMYLVRGQKDGAWHCPKCKAEFWDKVERRGKLSKDDIKKLAVKATSDILTALETLQQNIPCPRCITISMILLEDDSHYCPQCSMRFYPEGAPDVERIIDQKIKCGTMTLMKGSINEGAHAKHKSHSHRSGRRRKKKLSLQKNYYFPDDKGA